jgi:hypothetical protein
VSLGRGTLLLLVVVRNIPVMFSGSKAARDFAAIVFTVKDVKELNVSERAAGIE